MPLRVVAPSPLAMMMSLAVMVPSVGSPSWMGAGPHSPLVSMFQRTPVVRVVSSVVWVRISVAVTV